MKKYSTPIQRYWTSDMHLTSARLNGIDQSGRDVSNERSPTSAQNGILHEANSEGQLNQAAYGEVAWTAQLGRTFGHISQECLDRLIRLEAENSQLRQQCQNLEAQIAPLLKAVHIRGSTATSMNNHNNIFQAGENGKHCTWQQMDEQLRQLINILVHTNLTQNTIREDCRYLKSRVTCLEEANERLYALVKQHYPDQHVLDGTSSPQNSPFGSWEASDRLSKKPNRPLSVSQNAITNVTKLQNSSSNCNSTIGHGGSMTRRSTEEYDSNQFTSKGAALIRIHSSPAIVNSITESSSNNQGSKPSVLDDKSETGVKTQSSESFENNIPEDGHTSNESNFSWFYKFPPPDHRIRRSSAPVTSLADMVPHAWLQMSSLPTTTQTRRQPVGTRSHVILGSRFIPLESSKLCPASRSTITARPAVGKSLVRQNSVPERTDHIYVTDLNPIEEVDSNVQSFYDLKNSEDVNLVEAETTPGQASATLEDNDGSTSTQLNDQRTVLCRDMKFRYLHPIRLAAQILSAQTTIHPGSGRLRQSLDLETLLYAQDKIHKCRDAQRNLRCSVFSDTELLTGKFDITSTDDSAIESGEDEDMQSSDDLIEERTTDVPPTSPGSQVQRETPEGRTTSDDVKQSCPEPTLLNETKNDPGTLCDILTVTHSEDTRHGEGSRASIRLPCDLPPSPITSELCRTTRPNVPPPVVIHRKRFGVTGSSEGNLTTAITPSSPKHFSNRSTVTASSEIRLTPTGHSTPDPISSDTDSLVHVSDYPTTSEDSRLSTNSESIREGSSQKFYSCVYSNESSELNSTLTRPEKMNPSRMVQTDTNLRECSEHYSAGKRTSLSNERTLLGNNDESDHATHGMSNLPISRPATSPRTRRTTAYSHEGGTVSRGNSARRNCNSSSCTSVTQLPLPSKSFPSSPEKREPTRKYKTHLSQSIVKVSRPEKTNTMNRADFSQPSDMESNRNRNISECILPNNSPPKGPKTVRTVSETVSSSSSRAFISPPPIPPRTSSRALQPQTLSTNSRARLNGFGTPDHRSQHPYVVNLSPSKAISPGTYTQPPDFPTEQRPSYLNVISKNGSSSISSHSGYYPSCFYADTTDNQLSNPMNLQELPKMSDFSPSANQRSSISKYHGFNAKFQHPSDTILPKGAQHRQRKEGSRSHKHTHQVSTNMESRCHTYHGHQPQQYVCHSYSTKSSSNPNSPYSPQSRKYALKEQII